MSQTNQQDQANQTIEAVVLFEAWLNSSGLPIHEPDVTSKVRDGSTGFKVGPERYGEWKTQVSFYIHHSVERWLGIGRVLSTRQAWLKQLQAVLTDLGVYSETSKNTQGFLVLWVQLDQVAAREDVFSQAAAPLDAQHPHYSDAVALDVGSVQDRAFVWLDKFIDSMRTPAIPQPAETLVELAPYVDHSWDREVTDAELDAPLLKRMLSRVHYSELDRPNGYRQVFEQGVCTLRLQNWRRVTPEDVEIVGRLGVIARIGYNARELVILPIDNLGLCNKKGTNDVYSPTGA